MAPQPVAVHIPVGPPRAEELIYLPANEPLVLAYPCLPWVQHVAAGGAQQQASLPQFVAIRVFLLRNAIGTGPNDLAIACARGLPLPKVLSSLHPTVDEADYREGAFPQDLLSR